MRLITSGEQRNIELAATTQGISIEHMVRHAGDAVFNLVDRRYEIRGMGIAVLCGKSGNGADGFVVASRLLSAGARPIVILCNGTPKEGIAAVFLREAAQKGVAILQMDGRFDEAMRLVENAGLIIDAAFGIGFKGLLPPGCAALFDAAGHASAPVVSIDVPSGVDADNGHAAANAIRADVTVCLVAAKPVHILRSAARYCGEIVHADTGLPQAAYDAVERSTFLLTKEVVEGFLPPRAQDTHKYDFGSLICAVGSEPYRGAAVLCVKGALSGGAGLVQVASQSVVLDAVVAACPEAVLLDMDGNVDGVTGALEKATACVVGCGMADDWATDRIVTMMLGDVQGPAVVDAGALGTVRRVVSILRKRKQPTILTPHVGEFARLINTESANVYSDRLRRARAFSGEHGVVTVLKSDNTVVALPSGEVYINTAGNSGLSKGGSGDLLCGLIGSLCASGIEAGKAALLGVYLHSAAADLAAQVLPQQTITASIVCGLLPRAMAQLLQMPQEEKKLPSRIDQTMALLEKVRGGETSKHR